MKLTSWLRNQIGRGTKARKSSLPRPKYRWPRLILEPLERRELLDAAGRQFIDQVYRDLLMRPAEPHGLEVWSRALDRGVSHAGVVQAIEASLEHRQVFVRDAYQAFLRRTPEPFGLNLFVSHLGIGGRTDDVRAGILGSPEYVRTQGGGTAAGFLRAVYRDVLGRAVDPAGASAWGARLARGVSTITVAQGIVSSPEADRRLVEGYYQRFLWRPAELSGRDRFVSRLQKGVREQAVVAGIVGSPGYFARLRAPRDLQAPSVVIVSPGPGLVAQGNVTVAGRVSDDRSGVASLQAQVDGSTSFPVPFDAAGNFSLTTTLPLDGSAEGSHTVRLRATDRAGHTTQVDRTFTLDTVRPISPVFDLSTASDTGDVGDQQTTAARVVLSGRTDPNLSVGLLPAGVATLADNTGLFQFPDIALTLGANLFTVEAVDAAGNANGFSLTIQRLEETTRPNTVLAWNQVLLEAVRLDATPPPIASRAMAMVHAAILDAVNALEGTPARYVRLSAPAGTSADAAVAAAAHRVLSYVYPAQQASFDAALATSLGQVPEGPSKADGITLGQAAGDAIIALRAHDGFDTFVNYVPGGGPGAWQLTLPMFDVAMLPQWATLQPFAMTSPDQFRPAGPPDLTSQTWADDFNEVKSLGRADSTTRTADQTQVARFWADGPGTYTPPGHWNRIAAQFAEARGDTLAQDARLFAELNITLADAAIVAWDAKYVYNTWRPITAIRAADTAGNDLVQADATWSPLLITPPFPEYVSGHSTFSGAAAAVLEGFFGATASFSTTSSSLPGVTRSFASFADAAAEAGRSRIYGGIHFAFANQDGLAAGRALAEYVHDTFSTATDVLPPQVILSTPASDLVTAVNLIVQGQVLDHLSGVATLEVQLDGGAFSTVAFDAMGNFVLPTTLALDGSADGAHLLRFRATDVAGNVSPGIALAFTLDTRAPEITLDSLANGSDIGAGSQVAGTADGTGSTITRLTYQLNGGAVMPVVFDPATGQFAQPLDLSRLAAGEHTLTVTAQDGAGHETAVSLTVSLAAPIPFAITRFTPLDGALEVGTTFRPQIHFSRPVDPVSLSADNFHATGPNGARLPARIVPAGDGSFAWLFFTEPMPGASLITMHVDGSTIRSAGDQTLLDADRDGVPGGVFDSAFSTVSLTPLLGTSLSGIVVDPGADLKPMTFDDLRAGPDGVIYTADDLFLKRLAGVKVFIVGLEDQVVFTDANGFFRFNSVPAGNVKLAVDGRTAANVPAGLYFPEMVMDMYLTAGVANTVMSSMGTLEEMAANRDRQEVYLPRLLTSILQDVSNTEPTMIGVNAESAPNLTAGQRQLLTIEVQPGSLLDQDGNPVTAGQVGISTVPPELVREMLPPGLLQHTFDITVQAPGITNFATPAPMTFPNLFDAAPGTQVNFLSFDHTTGRLVIEGTATVSADGLSVSTDPGTGITHPGWHGLTPPGGPGRPAEPLVCILPPPRALGVTDAAADCCSTGASLASLGPQSGGLFQLSRSITIPGNPPDMVEDFLFASDPPRGKLVIQNLQPCDPINPRSTELLIDVTVNNSTTNQFLTGLITRTFFLQAQESHTIEFFPKAFDQLKLHGLTTDLLYGAKVTVEVRQAHTGGLLPDQPRPFYVYRYVDAGDDASNDQLVQFLPTLADGPGASTSTRTFKVLGDPDVSADSPHALTAVPHFLAEAADPANPSLRRLVFDPQSIGEQTAQLKINTPEPNSRLVRALDLSGEGRDKYRVHLDPAGLEKLLTELAAGSTPQDIILKMNPPGMTLPGTFRLKVKDRPPTPAFILDATQIKQVDLQAALEGLLGTTNFSLNIATDTTSIPNQVHLTVDFPNAMAGTPSPLIEVEATGANLVSFSARPRARFGRITPHELALFDTPDKRAPLVAEVMGLIKDAFLGLKGIEYTDDLGKASLDIQWTVSDSGEVGLISGADIAKQTFELFKVTSNSGLYNRNSLAFRLSQPLTRTKSATAVVHVDNILEGGSVEPYVLERDQFVNALVSVAVHEAGHFFGLQHTSFLKSFPLDHEVQRLEVTRKGDPGDSFTLDIAREAGTYVLRATSTRDDVLEALLALKTIAASPNHVSVDGPTGGPWTVHFVRPGTPTTTPLPRFWGTDVPLLEINNFVGSINVVTHPVKDGRSELRVLPGTNRVVGTIRGRDDIMVGGGWPDLTRDRTFLPRFSRVALRLGTFDYPTLQQPPADVKDYVGLLKHSMKIPGNPLALSFEPEPDSETLPSEFLNVDFGPRLAVFQNDTDVGPEALEFGEVEVVGQTSVQHLTLLNFGSADLTIRGIRVVNGIDAFSTPALPVTILRPGETLDIDVTFDPRATGPHTGTLAIESDAESFFGRFEMTGTGRRTTAELRIHPTLTNNQGAFLVGRRADRVETGLVLTNDGVQPVTINDARVTAGEGDFVVVNFRPVTLQPGQSFTVVLDFRPSAAGLRRGVVEILSDDPNSPLLRAPVVGTGLVEGNLDLGNDFVAVETVFRGFNPVDGVPVLRTRSDAGGNWEFFLPPESIVHIVTFDPVSGLIAHGYARTNPSGQRTEFNIGAFGAGGGHDTDGDGLPDDIEFAIGTDPKRIDTDGDGLTDLAAINQGLNPLSDRPAITGIIAALDLGGQAHDIELGADPADPRRQLAYVATTSALAIVDITRFDRPILLSQLDLSGSPAAVDVDPETRIAAVAAQAGGVHLVNLADPARPQLLKTFPVDTRHVELFEGLAYLASADELIAFDPVAGQEVQRLSLGGPIREMRRDGAALFVLTDGVTTTLHAVDLSGLAMAARGSLTLSRRIAFAPGDNFFVADGVAWIPSLSGTSGGLLTVDVRSLDNPRLISDAVRNSFLPYAVALNGSGLGIVLAAGATMSGDSRPVVSVVDASNPNNAAALFTEFNLPDVGQSVALASGLAYIADGFSGLQVVNFLAYDQGTQPPSITLNLIEGDLDLAKPGLQLLEASAITLTARITDDVQVRNVELTVNGVAVRNEIAYPYNFTTTLPRAADGREVTLQLRATDTGGNVQLSAPVVIELLPDTIPPAIVSLEPPEGSTQALSFRKITVRFSEPLDVATVHAANFELLGPAGAVTPLTIRPRERGSSFEFVYAPLEGEYQFVLHAPEVRDRIGNPLGAGDIVRSFRVGHIVREPTIHWIGTAGGFWDDVNNWDAGRLPGEFDDVEIDVPGDVTITFRNANVFPQAPFASTVRSLVSNNAFSITSGTLRVTETMRVNNTFILRGSPSGDLLTTIATLSATVLQGTGGQGLTIRGRSRLEECVIQADISLAEDNTQVRIKGGLSLLGTAMIGNSVRISFEGTQTITHGEFITSNLMAVDVVGDSTVTFGADVYWHGFGARFQDSTFGKLTLINYGRIAADPGAFTILIQPSSFTNHGLLEARNNGQLDIDALTWDNSTTGRIMAERASLHLGRQRTTLWSNAGAISATNQSGLSICAGVAIQKSARWSNSGSIFSQDSTFNLGGLFSSADVENVRRSGGSVALFGVMDNTGRTFTFDETKGSWALTFQGEIIGGTLVLNNPVATLDVASAGQAVLNGVTINGHLELGVYHQPAAGAFGSILTIRNNLTLNGTISARHNPERPDSALLRFEGTQTVRNANPGSATAVLTGSILTLSGDVTFEAGVTFRGPVGVHAATAFPSRAIIYGDISGSATGAVGLDNVIHRGTATVDRGTLSFYGVNEGTITMNGGILYLGGSGGNDEPWHNLGTINCTATRLLLGGTFTPDDIGNMSNPGGTVNLTGKLDNANRTFIIDQKLGNVWSLGGDIYGGTVVIDPAMPVEVGGVFEDVTIDGDLESAVNAPRITFIGNITIHGTVHLNSSSGHLLTFGHLQRPNDPVVIHAGIFDMRSVLTSLEGYGTGLITFGPDVVIHGGRVQAYGIRSRPILNLGTIRAELDTTFFADSEIALTGATITNRGVIEATSRGVIRIENLAPNEGIIRAGAGSRVKITNGFTQSATGTVNVELAGTAANQIGRVEGSGNATLTGTLQVSLVGGFTPQAGQTFQVMTYASVNGTFGTVNVAGLPPGLVATAVYNPTSLSLIVGMALRAGGPPPGPSTGLPRLTREQVPLLFDAALLYWAAAGLTEQQLDLLGGVQVRVADLGGDLLGLAGGDTILLDDDAAGHGWFVDPTPLEDEEFRAADRVFAALADGPAAGRMDLLTVLLHELGHLAGLDDLDAAIVPDGLMTELLPTGARRLP